MAALKRKHFAPEHSASVKSKKSKVPLEQGLDTHPAKKYKKSRDERSSKNKENSDVPAESRPPRTTVLKAEEAAFPRGGASVLTPLEHKQIKIDAARDVLFEQSGIRGKRRDSADEDDDGSHGEEPSAPTKRKKRGSNVKSTSQKHAHERNTDTLRIEGLSYKRIVPGSVILGQVSEITGRDIALALPNNLTGYVPVTNISDHLTDDLEASLENADELQDKMVDLESLFSIGQYLRAYVVSTSDGSPLHKGRRHIELSLNPRQANSGLKKSDMVPNSMIQASVKSVEDHGLIMDIGLEDDSIRGFMSSKDVGHSIDYSGIKEGTVFLCLVTGLSSNGKILKLSADTAKSGIIKKSNYLSEAPTVDAFLPGTAIELIVTEVTTSGVSGQVMGMLDVTADVVHSGASSTGTSLQKKFKVGQKVKARIICTFPTSDTKKLGVSFLDQVLSLRPQTVISAGKDSHPNKALPISAIVEEAKVERVEPGIGVYLGVGVKLILAFVHISRMADKKVETLLESEGPYQTGSTHRARIVGYNAMDGVFLASMEESIINQPFLRIEDLNLGQVVKGTVEKLIVNADGFGGLLVKVAEGIVGLVPEMHVADTHLSHPDRKFKEGLSVTARVLSTDPEKRHFRLTLKKSLVNSDVPIFESYESISVGYQSPGTLVKVLPTGAVVHFYGSVRAFLPKAEMSEAFIQDPTRHFRVGQVVSVHVLSIDKGNEKMLVSCKDPSLFGAEQKAAFSQIKAGQLTAGIVSEKSSDDVVVELEGSKVRATLPIGHVSDGSEVKVAAAFKKIRVGQRLGDLLVLEKNESKRLVALSGKKSLCKAAKDGRLVTALTDLRPGMKAEGFVRNSYSGGIFIQFANSLVGLVLKSEIPDDMLLLPDYGVRPSQSITVIVSSVDYGQQKFLLSLKDDANKDEKPQRDAPGWKATVNPVDENMKSTGDYTLGTITKARICSVKATQLNVQLADNVQGRVDASHVFDSWEEITDRKRPLSRFRAKQVIPVRIVGVHDARSHRFLPITHRAGKNPVLELTTKPSELADDGKKNQIMAIENITVGSNHVAFINNITAECVWVSLSPNVRGRLRLLDLSDQVSQLKNIEVNFPVGSAIKVQVTGVDISNNRLDLSTRSAKKSAPVSFENLAEGVIVPGRVTKVTEQQVNVQLSDSVSGVIPLTELEDDYERVNAASYQKNEIVRVCVVGFDAANERVDLSARPSRVLNSSLPIKDRVISSISQLKVNDVVRGFIKHTADTGVFVTLSANVTAYIRVSDLSDSFIKDWKAAFQVDQLVKGKVVSLDPLLNHVQLSLKSSVVDRDYVPPITVEELKVGQVVTGKIRKVEEFGVFIVVDNSANVSGLCHRTEIADRPVRDAKTIYDEGDAVKAKILKIDRASGRINFGLKSAYLHAAEEGSEDEDDDEQAEMVDGLNGVTPPDDGDDVDDEDDDSDGGVDISNVKMMPSGLSDENDSDTAMRDAPTTEAKGLSTSGFDWSGNIVASDDDDDDDNDRGKDTRPASAAHLKKKRSGRASIKADHTADLDLHGPRSTSDFERLLLTNPSSSELWLQYMAFQLQLSEVASARELGERALQTIDAREEEEKVNVWVGLLNLENTYGTPEALEEVFQRACQYTDGLDMHGRLASIYTQSEKFDLADATYAAALKKYPATLGLYTSYLDFLFSHVSAERARALLPRALQSLPERTHIQLTTHFALLEFRLGEPERGRTLFEGLLSRWPKRVDLWNVQIDAEAKKGERQRVRDLFERLIGSGLKPSKAKGIFKKWVQLEAGWGEGGDEEVKRKAAGYVAAHGA
ncbi:MAG: hypothetical protein M1825_003249 [Sarcosagium campestre]|nr:MAG: hypothetical protein M1825_003249 [Sarcosagium campestre]